MRKNSLTKHINLVHLKLREHAFPYCPGVAYQTKSHLQTHIETCTSTCRYCPGVAFVRKNSLAKHINLVHLKLREHAFPYCPGVAYQTKSHLQTHIETVHEKRQPQMPKQPTRSYSDLGASSQTLSCCCGDNGGSVPTGK